MAEEKDDVNEPVVETVNDAPEYSETEQRAMELGWRPKDKFEGSEDEWRSARDFIERGDMIGKIRSQSKQLQSVEQALKHISAQNAQMYTKGYQNAVAELKAEKRQALADGDAVQADILSEKIVELQAEARTAISAAQAPAKAVMGPDPEHEVWLSKNQWYHNPTMQKFADALAVELINQNKGNVTPDQVREYVSKTVRQEFKHRMGETQAQGAPNPDGEGRGSRSGGSQTTSKIEAGMSDQERQIMNTMVKATGMTKKEYLEQYSNAR